MNRPRPAPGYRLEPIGDEAVLYFPGDSRVLYCNPTALLIWHLSDGARTVAEIVAELEAAYPEAADVIRADVEATVATLTDCGAIEWV